ncbi:alpha-L-fucosidase [Pelagicoccus mobilis]|uniref:alpha-L-fucosidase n=1 Tax=Pelagicoccus mobilis TaxID=415221 RepID=A0A934RXW0_9BACT|nr:alpha-L-fucosidase [Pelagicoccus mobilis]MBK1875889.1 alpha-L-fucosidase [Pelagicoccus mobilis]
MFPKLHISILISALFLGGLTATGDQGLPSADRIEIYKTIGDVELKLHIFEPPGHDTSHKTPAIVFFHGGGWRGGGYTHFSGQCEYLAERGMVAMTASYRTEKGHGTTPQECVKDAKSAIRWVRAHADELGIDPNRIAAGGGSAGGHMAAATATLRKYDEEGEDTAISCVPDALVLLNPVADNSSIGFGHNRVKEYWRDFSPLHNIGSDAPPTLILTGSLDTAFKAKSAKAYKERMSELGLRCDLIIYKGQPHAFFNRERSEKMYFQTLQDADTFLTSLGYLPNKEDADNKEIAELAAKMDGASEDGLHWRLKLSNPLPMPKEADWFEDAGLGLFMHWGPASAHYGSPWVMRRQAKDGSNRPMVIAKEYYETSMGKFTAKSYDPEPWMKAASKAGFRYAVLTSKHHDGYTLWPSAHSDLGTQTYLEGRDLLQPYADAVRNNGMKLGFYFSGVDWWLDREYMNYSWDKEKGWNFAGQPFDAQTLEALPMDIVEQKRQIAFEVMDRYRPDLWWWDSGLPVSLEETAERYNPNMLFNNRGNFHHGGVKKGTYPGAHYVTPENFHMVNWENMKLLQKLGRKWEVCMNFNRGKGWFYEGRTGDSEHVGGLEGILFALARVRCWGGNMLLNIKPREDGTLPEANYDAFAKMGRWMEWGAVSMFEVEGTHFPEESNVPVTTSKDGGIWYLHARPGESQWQKGAFYEHCEPGKPIRVNNVPRITSAKSLRTGEAVPFRYEAGTLMINNPSAGPDGLHEVIEIRFL